MRGARGFSIVEMLVATTVILVVSAAALAMLSPSTGASESQAEASDAQQRLRVAANALVVDLASAGSGPDRGPMAGPLLQGFAPILPFRRGTRADDPPGSFFDDRITLLSVPPAAPHATLAAAGPPLDSDWLGVEAQPQCPPTDPLCLFSAGADVAIFDGLSNGDVVRITGISVAPTPMLQHANQPLTSTAYRSPQTSIAGVTSVSYAFDRQALQLVVSKGVGAVDAPVVDNVVGLTFTYYGDPQPPQLATYGPKPPPLDEQASAAWPPGENCAFAVVEGVRVPRLPTLAGGPSLVPLTGAQLADGPWCPDEWNASRWDADLLRVRAVRVSIRVQAAMAALRGPAGVLFAVAGTGRDASRWVPDRQIAFQVAPRGLNMERAP